MKKNNLPYVSYEEEQIREFREDPERAMEYLNACVEVAFEENEPELVLNALAVIAKAYGITKLAKKTHIQRESIHRMFSKGGNPEWKSIFKMFRALKIRMKLEFLNPLVV
ncbi:MAG: putative addiction module antidote protein [Deltaproteobacteria bacterium]|nr:MAG: putative addiction module antidote protein [Deltaproteobacteria bacterium]